VNALCSDLNCLSECGVTLRLSKFFLPVLDGCFVDEKRSALSSDGESLAGSRVTGEAVEATVSGWRRGGLGKGRKEDTKEQRRTRPSTHSRALRPVPTLGIDAGQEQR
jgi:hypothetical protein